MPDFKEMRNRIQIVDVLYRYNVRLRRSIDSATGKPSDYASCACPLPTHPPDDRNNNAFGVHLPSNRWQCKHPTCGKINGVGDKWGDCINLVAVMGRMDFKSAGKQLESWFPNKKTAFQNGAPEAGQSPHPNIRNDTSSAVAVKGYMQDTEAWFLELSRIQEGESEEAYRKRVVNGIKTRCLQSYQAGKLAAKV